MEAVHARDRERRDSSRLTLHRSISVTEGVENNDLQNSIVNRTVLRAYRFGLSCKELHGFGTPRGIVPCNNERR